MTALAGMLEAAPNDPLVLAGVLVAFWLPVCAVGLLVLWSLAQTQEFFGHRRKPRSGIVLPPAEVRPLATRRYVTPVQTGSSRGMIGLTRVALAVGAVASLTFLALSANGQLLLSALNR